MNEKLASRTRLLFGCWCVLYVLFDFASSIYAAYQQAIYGTDPTMFLGSFQLATLAIVALFFLPSLFGIYHLTKKYDSQKLKKVVLWVLRIMSIWTVAMVFCTIAEIIVPGFLT